MKTILVVDDDSQILDYLTSFLERSGYKVLSADDGNKALEMVAEHRPDLVLLDIMMPGTHGFSVCHQIKSHEATKGIKVVFLTAKAFPADKRQGEQVGGDGFLVKPIDMKNLLAALEKNLGDQPA